MRSDGELMVGDDAGRRAGRRGRHHSAGTWGTTAPSQRDLSDLQTLQRTPEWGPQPGIHCPLPAPLLGHSLVPQPRGIWGQGRAPNPAQPWWLPPGAQRWQGHSTGGLQEGCRADAGGTWAGTPTEGIHRPTAGWAVSKCSDAANIAPASAVQPTMIQNHLPTVMASSWKPA